MRKAALLAGLSLTVCASQVNAQAPEGSSRLTVQAATDSLAVLKELDAAVRNNSKDAASWYRRGMVAWALYERTRHLPPIRGLDWTLLTRLADTSLRIALEIEPTNERYFLAVARYLLGSSTPYRRWGPYGVFDEALARARATGDPSVFATAAIQAGRLYWGQWHWLSCGTPPSLSGAGTESPDAGSVELPPANLEGTRNPFARPQDYMGEVPYLKSLVLFREAFETQPTNPRAFKYVAMALADQKRWLEVAGFARARISAAPKDGWAWMTLGLASHRVGATVAAAAFDSGMKYLDAEERSRLFRIERILGNPDRDRYDRLSDSGRATNERFFWRNQNRLWSVPELAPRLEFYARVTFAELRWTEEEVGLNGVNSDLGNIYIRTGARRPPVDPQSTLPRCIPMRMAWYEWNDTTVLRGPHVTWNNIATGRIDSIPAQVARFRGPGDSTDVLFAALPPVDVILRATDINGPARTDFWLVTDETSEVARDSVRPTRAGVQTFIHRVAPGMYVYRAEASADGSLVAARATAAFRAGDDARTGFRTTGFGMSDVLVATTARPRQGRGQRWTDFAITPLAGPTPRGSGISLLWEVYDAGQDAGRSRYSIVVSIRQPEGERSAGGRIAASIVSGIAGAIGISRGDNHIEFSFERDVPWSAIAVDNIGVALGDTPPGTYLLTLQVIDRVTGEVTGRSQELTITPPQPTPPRR